MAAEQATDREFVVSPVKDGPVAPKVGSLKIIVGQLVTGQMGESCWD